MKTKVFVITVTLILLFTVSISLAANSDQVKHSLYAYIAYMESIKITDSNIQFYLTCLKDYVKGDVTQPKKYTNNGFIITLDGGKQKFNVEAENPSNKQVADNLKLTTIPGILNNAIQWASTKEGKKAIERLATGSSSSSNNNSENPSDSSDNSNNASNGDNTVSANDMSSDAITDLENLSGPGSTINGVINDDKKPTPSPTNPPDKTEKVPTTPDGWSSKGTTLRYSGNYEEAIKAYDNALALDPKNLDALKGKAICLFSTGNYEQGLACAEEALKINPGQDNVMMTKGDCLFGLHKYDESIQVYKDTLAKLPSSGSKWMNTNLNTRIGGCYVMKQNYKEALNYYDEALKYSPGDVYIEGERNKVLELMKNK